MSDRCWRVLVDADVLFSRVLRDWILLLSEGGGGGPLFDVWWSEDILAEALSRLRDRRPDLNSASVEIIGDRLREAWASNRISAFPPARDTFVGQDDGDLHVHSAAVAA